MALISRNYSYFACALALSAAVALPRRSFAVAFQDPNALSRAPVVTEVASKKEFQVAYPKGQGTDGIWKEYEAFVVVRQEEDPNRKGWYDFRFVGRAAVAETTSESARMVLYKPFRDGEVRAGDHLVKTGDPLTLDEMNMLRKEVLGVLQRDKELEDMYTGLLSFKLGMYSASLSSTSTNDTNSFKRADRYSLYNLGFRWWFFFNPAIGLNLEYATGTIPTKDFRRQDKESTQTYINPGLMYRSRFLFVPAVYSLTYFINSFNTTNADDFLISSTYSGVNLGMTFYFPYRKELLRLGPFAFAFNNVEVGGGIAPAVNVADSGGYSRGTSSSGRQLSANAGLEFGLVFRPWRWTNDLFFVFEGGLQKYDLEFSGPTTGLIEGRTPIPIGGKHSETQMWYGLRIKYNMRDILGELVSGL